MAMALVLPQCGDAAGRDRAKITGVWETTRVDRFVVLPHRDHTLRKISTEIANKTTLHNTAVGYMLDPHVVPQILGVRASIGTFSTRNRGTTLAMGPQMLHQTVAPLCTEPTLVTSEPTKAHCWLSNIVALKHVSHQLVTSGQDFLALTTREVCRGQQL